MGLKNCCVCDSTWRLHLVTLATHNAKTYCVYPAFVTPLSWDVSSITIRNEQASIPVLSAIRSHFALSIRSIHLQHLFRIGYGLCSCISTSRSTRSRATSTEYSVPVYETTDSPLDISLGSYRYQLRNGTSLGSAHVAEDNTRTVSEWWVRK